MVLAVEQHGDVHVVRWEDGENRLNLASVAEWHAALDALEAVEGPLALVVTGTGNFFSNGLDLDRFGAEPEEAGPTVAAVHRLLGRLLLFPVYAVAAIERARVRSRGDDHGLLRRARHAQRPGVLVPSRGRPRAALQRRDDRGRDRTPPAGGRAGRDAHRPAVRGRGRAALGIVTDTADEARLLDTAIVLATPIAGKDRRVIAEHKRLLFGTAAAACGHEG